MLEGSEYGIYGVLSGVDGADGAPREVPEGNLSAVAVRSKCD